MQRPPTSSRRRFLGLAGSTAVIGALPVAITVRPAEATPEMMATAIVDDLPYKSGDEVLAFVNGMGGTPLIELYVVYNELNNFLKGKGITIGRNLIGSYITSLEMAGCSITLLKLDDQLKALWDAPVKTPGMRWGA